MNDKSEKDIGAAAEQGGHVDKPVSCEMLEKRLMNTEMALVALWSFLQDTMPPAIQANVGEMMNEFFDTNSEMGADFDLRKGWNIDS